VFAFLTVPHWLDHLPREPHPQPRTTQQHPNAPNASSKTNSALLSPADADRPVPPPVDESAAAASAPHSTWGGAGAGTPIAIPLPDGHLPPRVRFLSFRASDVPAAAARVVIGWDIQSREWGEEWEWDARDTMGLPAYGRAG
jgi:hypothetical protein